MDMYRPLLGVLAVVFALIAGGGPRSSAASPETPSVMFCDKAWPLTATELTCYDGRVVSPRPENAMDLAPLAELKELRQLRLISGEIEFILTLGVNDVRPLAALRHLEVLELGHTTLTDVAPLAALGSSLRRLSLHASPVRDIKALSRLTGLEELDLSCTAVTDVSAVAKLTKLEKLDLTTTAVRDLRPLTALKHLEWLGLSVGDIDPAQLAALKKALPSLRVTEGRRY